MTSSFVPVDLDDGVLNSIDSSHMSDSFEFPSNVPRTAVCSRTQSRPGNGQGRYLRDFDELKTIDAGAFGEVTPVCPLIFCYFYVFCFFIFFCGLKVLKVRNHLDKEVYAVKRVPLISNCFA